MLAYPPSKLGNYDMEYDAAVMNYLNINYVSILLVEYKNMLTQFHFFIILYKNLFHLDSVTQNKLINCFKVPSKLYKFGSVSILFNLFLALLIFCSLLSQYKLS